MNLACVQLFFAGALWTLPCTTAAVAVNGITELLHLNQVYMEDVLRNSSDTSAARARRKRFISSKDMTALLDYHNRVRSQVFPPAANMEYMVGHFYVLFFIYLFIYIIIVLGLTNTQHQLLLLFSECNISRHPGRSFSCKVYGDRKSKRTQTHA